jgi:hypothetical protein
MLNKSRFAIAAALILGAVSAAQAANENMDEGMGGYACGPLHQRLGGRAANPVYNRTICYGRGAYGYARSHRIHRRWSFF